MAGRYVRIFTDTASGVTVRGVLLGNGGTAVPLQAIEHEVQRVRAGRTGEPRFLEPCPGYVRILRCDREYAYDDPMGWVDLPLVSLSVEADEDERPRVCQFGAPGCPGFPDLDGSVDRVCPAHAVVYEKARQNGMPPSGRHG